MGHEQQRQLRHAPALVDRVASETGAETLLSRVIESEDVAEVFRLTVDAAARTGHEAKRRARVRSHYGLSLIHI